MIKAFFGAQPHEGYKELVSSLFGGCKPPSTSSPSSSSATSSSPPPLLTDPSRAFVMTTNIDAMMERAGVPPEALFETVSVVWSMRMPVATRLTCPCHTHTQHGTAHRLQCTSVGTAQPCPNSSKLWEMDDSTRQRLISKLDAGTLQARDLPRCRCCGALARPNVSHVTDSDDYICTARKAPQRERALDFIRREKERGSTLVILEIGSGVSEHSLRLDSEVVIKRQRTSGMAFLVRIDPGDATTPEDDGCVGIPLGFKDAMLRLGATVRAANAHAGQLG